MLVKQAALKVEQGKAQVGLEHLLLLLLHLVLQEQRLRLQHRNLLLPQLWLQLQLQQLIQLFQR